MSVSELKYTQGPSAEQWESHRETITQLYHKMSLKDLSDFMKRHHSFNASKRMYDSRFRRWQVFKTKQAVRQPVTHGSPNPPKARKSRVTKSRGPEKRYRQTGQLLPKSTITDNSYRSSLPEHHFAPSKRTTRNGRCVSCQRTNSSSPSSDIETTWSHTTALNRNADRVDSIGTPVMKEEPLTPTDGQSVRAHHTHVRESFSSHSPTAEHFPGYGYMGSSDSRPISLIGSTTSCGPFSNLICVSQVVDQAGGLPPQIATPRELQQLNIILGSIHQFYSHEFSKQDDIQSHYTTAASRPFWFDINTGIYLLKYAASKPLCTKTPSRAFAAIQSACANASKALSSIPFDFPLQLLLRLSPFNTRICLPLRANILSFLSSMASTTLAPMHPLAALCTALAADDHSLELSARAFTYMASLLGSHRICSVPTVRHRLSSAQAKWSRREGNVTKAVVQARDVVALASVDFGPYDEKTRAAASELVHAYMAAGQYTHALHECQRVIRCPGPGSRRDEAAGGDVVSGEVEYFTDGIAAHGMEDVAELYEKMGDSGEGIVWLKRAVGIALRVWGQAPTTMHILDKLVDALREDGRSEDARTWEKVGLLEAK
ncbi:hypothetical protein EJ05DRAFT_477208 [Pseudovirgaria hyperparasitica]|uniref:Clr5 domain-containing protein n=1 Tax=Pseudovirgaria hyperparasitica TaxID=470096 RepID=A0A6A6W614_9PEZI|nr:uncharacterized protein EJ05DRAFT_477208 [Pseudovirgaria hyperparasitica]KAF2756987.1 hypothetical protein EJ05DRAFT_477208 [Pseudovirgaria hyperparasitica]